MKPAKLRHASAELDLKRKRRELLFWTIATTLALIVLGAMTVAFVVSLVFGGSIDPARMAVGAGIMGANVAGGGILKLLARSAQNESSR